MWQLYHVNLATGERVPFNSGDKLTKDDALQRAAKCRYWLLNCEEGSNWTVRALPDEPEIEK